MRSLATEISKDKVLEAALGIAQQYGILAVTRDEVARRADVSTGTVSHAFGTMVALQNELVREAVVREMWDVVAAGIVLRMPAAEHLSAEQREKAVRAVIK